jgi:hypothetical protein
MCSRFIRPAAEDSGTRFAGGSHRCMLNLSDSSAVAALLVEAADRQESIAAITEHEGPAWTIEFEDGARCVVELANGPARLVLTGSVGRPSDGRLADVHGLALSFNLLWEETGGCRLAGGEENELLLLQELYPESLENDQVGDLFMWFEAMRALWEHLIHAGQPIPEPATLQEMVHGLRV